MSDIVFIGFMININWPAKIYRNIVHLNGDEEPRTAVLLEPGFCSALFTDYVGVTEQFVRGGSKN